MPVRILSSCARPGCGSRGQPRVHDATSMSTLVLRVDGLAIGPRLGSPDPSPERCGPIDRMQAMRELICAPQRLSLAFALGESAGVPRHVLPAAAGFAGPWL